jgi:hypothetical protein
MSQVPEITPPNALQRIRNASNNSSRWLPAADAAAEILRTDAWRATHPSAGDWIVDAAHQAGYSVNAFRRQIRVTDFLRSNVTAEQWPTLLQRDLPFGNLEVLHRLFDTNPEQALAMLPDVLKGEKTYRDMRELYHQSVAKAAGRKVYANRAQQFEVEASECIRANLSEFLGAIDTDVTVQFLQALRGFPYARPDLLLCGSVKNSQGTTSTLFVDAFEIKLFGVDDSKQILIRTLEQISLFESFFRQTWLIYPRIDPPVENHERHIQELCMHLLALDMTSVGVGLVATSADQEDTSSRAFEIRVLPTPNTAPKRAHLITSFVQRQ